MKKRILITGTAGFIYSNFIRNAIYDKKNDYEFFSVDKIAYSPMMNNIYQSGIHSFFIADICDEHIMERIFEYVSPQIIVHGAAEANVDKSIKTPNIFMTSNVIGTQNLINLAVKHKTELFLYQSTDEVLGSLGEDEAPWKENAPLDPRNAYSASKAAGEMLIKAAHNTHGLEYIIARSCNNLGARQDPSKLIPRVIKCILNKEPIPVYGDGKQSRDWIHTIDNCQAILSLLQKGQRNEIYNISAGQERKNIDTINAICDLMGDGKQLLTQVKDRLGHDKRYALNNEKIRSLGWAPRYRTFEDMAKATVDWYLDNKYFLNN